MLYLQNLIKDARNFQILWLGSFLTYGLIFLQWESNLAFYLSVFSGALISQAVFIHRFNLSLHAFKSAVITSLGLCLLLKVNHPLLGLLAASIAIAAKFFIRYDGKHIFNPANLGIIATILISGNAWVSPGQWGNEVNTFFLIASCGMLITLKVGRWDAGISFLATLFGLEFIRTVIYQGWPLDHLLHSFSSGTLMLFAFFMITDPMTSPNDRKARIIWAASLGVTSFILSAYMQLYTAPIWALFGWCLLTPIFDKLFVKPKFQWI